MAIKLEGERAKQDRLQLSLYTCESVEAGFVWFQGQHFLLLTYIRNEDTFTEEEGNSQ